jgi:DNA polymerase III epsilon subunit-like protein
VFDLETSGLKAEYGAQVTQIAALTVMMPECRIVGKPYNVKARLNDATVRRLYREVRSEEPLPHYSVHGALTVNQYHGHFQHEPDPETGKVKHVTSIGKDGKEYTNPVYRKMDEAQLGDVLEHSHGDREGRPSASALPTEKEALQGFVKYCLDSGSRGLVGHNIMHFDMPFLSKRLNAYRLMDMGNEPAYDTMVYSRLAFLPALETLQDQVVRMSADTDHPEEEKEVVRIMGLLRNAQGYSSSKLQDLMAALGVSGGKAHDALGDVETTVSVLKAMSELVQDYSLALKDLQSWLAKHKDVAQDAQLERDRKLLEKHQEQKQKQQWHGGA